MNDAKPSQLVLKLHRVATGVEDSPGGIFAAMEKELAPIREALQFLPTPCHNEMCFHKVCQVVRKAHTLLETKGA